MPQGCLLPHTLPMCLNKRLFFPLKPLLLLLIIFLHLVQIQVLIVLELLHYKPLCLFISLNIFLLVIVIQLEPLKLHLEFLLSLYLGNCLIAQISCEVGFLHFFKRGGLNA